MCEPVTATAVGTSAVAGVPVATATLAAAGPGLMGAGTATGALTTAGSFGTIGFAPLGASFASVAPSASLFGSLGSLGSFVSGASDVLSVASPLFSAASAMSSAGDLKELGRIQAEAAALGMNQDLLEQRMVALDRREKANQQLAGLFAGGQAGQSLVALTQKKLDDAERDRQFSETMIGNIEISGRTRIAGIESRTEQAVGKAQSGTGQAAGQAVGFLAERFT